MRRKFTVLLQALYLYANSSVSIWTRVACHSRKQLQLVFILFYLDCDFNSDFDFDFSFTRIVSLLPAVKSRPFILADCVNGHIQTQQQNAAGKTKGNGNGKRTSLFCRL